MTRIESLAIGQSAEISTLVTSREIELFAEATGDRNPVHLDEEAAAKSQFGGRIAHGMLTAGFVSAAIASKLPGPGSVYLGQTLRFTRPVRVGDTITVKLEIIEVFSAKRRVRLATTCINQHGETVMDGEATVMVPDERAPPGGKPMGTRRPRGRVRCSTCFLTFHSPHWRIQWNQSADRSGDSAL